MPKVSVIIPVYNSAKYLNECLDSLIYQTLDDFEVICINDGSTDNSLDILQEYAQKDSRFIVINKENEGQGVARNIGIEKAKGEYLLCLDSDDWLEKNALELAYNKILDDNTDIIFFDAYRHVEKFKQKYLLKYTDIYKNFKCKPFTPKEAGKTLLLTNGLTFKMYKLDFIKKCDIKYSENKFIEDAIFYIKAMLNAKSISCLSKPIYNYRILNKSSSTDYKKYFDSIPYVYKICFNTIIDFETETDILYSFLENRKNTLLYFYRMTPFYAKAKYYKMMKKIINEHFSKYELPSELQEINSMNFFQYAFITNFRKCALILKTYFI